MKNNKLHINVLIPTRLNDKEEARKLIVTLSKFPCLVPQRYDSCEPIRTPFNPDNIDLIIDSWFNSFLWKRTKPLVEGTIWIAWGPRPVHGSLHIAVEPKESILSELIDNFQQICSDFNADFASFHWLTMNEISSKPAWQTVFCLNPTKQTYNHSISTYNLVKAIPELYWGTVFGSPYIEMFGREKLLKTPVPIAKELPNGSIYIQLSNSPFDLDTDYDKIDIIRQDVKRYLNNNAFYDRNKPEDFKYRIPHFRLQGYTDEDMRKYHGVDY